MTNVTVLFEGYTPATEEQEWTITRTNELGHSTVDTYNIDYYTADIYSSEWCISPCGNVAVYVSYSECGNWLEVETYMMNN